MVGRDRVRDEVNRCVLKLEQSESSLLVLEWDGTTRGGESRVVCRHKQPQLTVKNTLNGEVMVNCMLD